LGRCLPGEAGVEISLISHCIAGRSRAAGARRWRVTFD
jgi:hypothetical protein